MRKGSLLSAGVASLLAFTACNPDPGEVDEVVTYRDGSDGGTTSGERGSVKISEVLWSGSVDNNGLRDPADVFVEIRNESHRTINISGWILQIEGVVTAEHRLPDSDLQIPTGSHIFIAAKSSGCFPEPDLILPELHFPDGDPFELTLMDKDERLIEGIGSTDSRPFAGGYDWVYSRSMERVELMFGGDATLPMAWHYYTPAAVEVPNNDRIAPDCQQFTHASPGRPNSPDYSGASASGDLE